MPWNNRNNRTTWAELALMVAIVVLAAAVPASIIITAVTHNTCEVP